MTTSRRALVSYLERSLDSFLWMKKLSRGEILGEIRSMRTRPIFQTEPWLHQYVCFYIAMCEPRFLFLLDMGLGKSKILLDIFTHLQRTKKMDRACVLVPRLLNISSWLDAIDEHSQLEPWHCDVQEVEEKRERLLNPRGDLTIIDYQGLHWALCRKEKGKKGPAKLVRDDKLVRMFCKQYNVLAPDESHKLGNPESLWFSLVNQISQRMDYCYATTGTLFSKDIEAAWAQFYLVDRGETFGINRGLFRAAFYDEVAGPFGMKRTISKRTMPDFRRMLQHRSLRYDEREVHELPERVRTTKSYGMAPEQREHYLRAVEGFLEANGAKQEMKAQWFRMRQIAAGYLGWNDEHGEHLIHFEQNPKLDGLEYLAERALESSKVVISYEYTETGQIIVDRLKAAGHTVGWLYGGTKNKSAMREQFLDPSDRMKVLVMNSDAGGTGNDGLQKVSRYLFFYETPTSPTARQQVLKRVHRPGQLHRTFIYDLAMKRSVDTGILKDVLAGRDMYEEVVNGQQKLGKNLLLGN